MNGIDTCEPDLSILPARTGRALSILYCGDLAENATSRHRFEAMRRLGHRVTGVDLHGELLTGGSWRNWLAYRFGARQLARRGHQLILDRLSASGERFDLAWFDKALWVGSKTLRALSGLGVTTVHYTSDLPFSERSDPGHGLLRRTLRDYDHCLVPSPRHVPPYQAVGCRSIRILPFGFDPRSHYPPPSERNDANPRQSVCFIGTPYGERAEFLTCLRRDHGIEVAIHGGLWKQTLSRGAFDLLRPQPPKEGAAYRQTIWNSDICLGFVTHAMCHDEARRWVEIAACGGFLLAETPQGSQDLFVDGEHAAFFSNVEDCARQISRYLSDPSARRAMAERAMRRVWPARANDVVIDRVLAQLSVERAR